jgi:hypothetical protein
VPEPFIPMAANSLNGAAQQRPGAKAFDAPVPEGPEPYETQRTLRDDVSRVRCYRWPDAV